MSTRLQQARYDGLMRRVGDLKGGGSKVSEVISEVFPTFDLENVPAELYALNGWTLGFGAVQLSPLAANNNLIQIFNPVGSGKLVVPTRIDISVSPGMNVEYATNQPVLANLTASSLARDTRQADQSLAAQIRDVQQAGSLSPHGIFFIAVNVAFVWNDLDGLFVLAPGTGLTIGSTVVNSTLIVTFHWRERVAEPSELNF